MTTVFESVLAPGCLALFALGGAVAQTLPDADPRRSEEEVREGGAECLAVTRVRIVGVHALPRPAVDALQPEDGSCLSRKALNVLLRSLSALYLQRGHVAARVLPQPVAADGELVLRVDEGRVVRMEASSARGDVAALFPDALGKPLDLRALEQGLDQANRLPTVAMHARVNPVPGGVELAIDERSTGGRHGFIALDNGGEPATGVVQGTLSFGIDNPGGVYDAAGVSVGQTLDRLPGHRRRSLALYYSRPYGYWTTSLAAGWSDYYNRQRLIYHTVALSGQTASASVKLERVLWRDAEHIDGFSLQLTHKRLRHYLMDELRELASPTLTVAGAGYTKRRVFARGEVSVRGGLERGVGWLGARQPHGGIEGAPVARFNKWVFGIDTDFSFAGGTLSSRFDWQASRDALPAAEQMEITAPGAIRGHARNPLAGESGWFWRNTLQYRIATAQGGLLPRLGLDAGRVLWHGARPPWRGASGASAGLGLLHGRISMDLEYSRPLGRPSGFVAEGHRLLAGVAWLY
ncbi:ShlB/FhaC/HecB family hemolysin secretion/activation protein [Paludibacterium yongneupense]|uniref:ShlB/FhaC/HecB family hemolysin secretion/activation protein n=1 Tax=Paludibacterium yongneupense TaxID=400061 RepID=UPI00041C6145|nr:ShlB/FhaC/HecB family hemolysin secretion/activation protein [Paludibacterium yongneupense]